MLRKRQKCYIIKMGDDNVKNEKGLSDFIKFAYKCNKVRDIEEAFEEYPVEEEWHQGKIENVLNEIDVQYNEYKIGDIVFVKEYLYPDGSKGKNHFFVIIDQNNVAIPIENFGMLILYKILNNQIAFKIGKVDNKRIEEFKQSFYEINKNKNTT